MKTWLKTAIGALALVPAAAIAQVPAGYPADYAQTIAAAKKEGKVVIYSALDTKAATPLIKDFSALYPDIKVEYNDMNSTELYNRFIAEVASGQGSADVMWSSAMDLQVKLVDEGQALAYKSPESAKLPGWSVYKSQAYGTTYEPAVFIYNKRLVTGDEIPQDHAAFAKLINSKADKYKGKVTTYDIEKSGVGFMFVVQDTKYFPGMKDLQKGFGASSYKVYSSTGNMLEKVSSGEHLLGYNVLGSYALVRAKKDPNLGVALPKDLHAGALARDVHRQGGEEPQRGQALGRLHPVAARPEADRQRRRALLDARRRGRRIHGRQAEQAAGRRGEADSGRGRDHRVPRFEEAP